MIKIIGTSSRRAAYLPMPTQFVTRVDLGVGQRELEIVTGIRPDATGIESVAHCRRLGASVAQSEDAIVVDTSAEYTRVLAQESRERCSLRAIQDAHRRAAAMLPRILPEIAGHYRWKLERTANRHAAAGMSLVAPASASEGDRATDIKSPDQSDEGVNVVIVPARPRVCDIADKRPSKEYHYQARLLDPRAAEELLEASKPLLSLRVGECIGTLSFDDQDCIAGCVVDAIDRERADITLTGARSGRKVNVRCSVVDLKMAIERALRLGHRHALQRLPVRTRPEVSPNTRQRAAVL